MTLADVGGPAGDLAHYAGPPATSSTVSYLYYNGHGDLAAETDQTGNRTALYGYDPYGGPNEGIPTNDSQERYTGRWDKKLDPSSLLIEMGARPYDPTTGRFLAIDPIDGGSLNNYDYAGEDPLNIYDLNGTCWTGLCWAKHAAQAAYRHAVKPTARATVRVGRKIAPYASSCLNGAATGLAIAAVTGAGGIAAGAAGCGQGIITKALERNVNAKVARAVETVLNLKDGGTLTHGAIKQMLRNKTLIIRGGFSVKNNAFHFTVTYGGR